MMEKRRSFFMVILNYFIMCLIFGTTFLAIKIGVDAGLPSFFSAGIRFFIAGILLYSFMVWKGKVPLKLVFRKEMLITGVCLTFGTFATLYWAEQYVTSGVAAVLSATGPMMILAINAILLKHKGSKISVLGCVLGIIGVTFLILPGLSFKMSYLWVLGCVVIVIGEAFYASGTIYARHVIGKFKTISPIALNAAQMLHGGLLLMILSFFTENIELKNFQSTASLSSLIYLIVFGSMVGHSLYYWLVSRTNPVFPSTWLYISPVIAVIIGVIFYNEYISWLTGVGVLSILIGSLLVNFETLQKLIKRKRNLNHVISAERY
jgi:drug/metabolite transporter (DMT)-like permease